MRIVTRNILKFAGIACLAGVILIAVSYAFGGSNHNGSKVYDLDLTNEYKKDIHTIDVDLSFGNLSIEEGDSFCIRTFNVNKKTFTSEVKDGVWTIGDAGKKKGMHLWDVITSDAPIVNIGKNHEVNKVILTVPKGVTLEELDITLGAGNATLNNLLVKDFDLEVGAGNMEGDNIQVKQYASIEVGAGNLEVTNFNGKDVELECGIGDLDISGNIIGDSSATTGMGSIEITLDKPQTEYEFDVECGLGDVTINDREYHFTTDSKVYGERANNYFDLECGMGDIEITNKE